MSLFGFYLAIRPFRFISQITPENYHVDYETINLKTEDGLNLAGWFIPSKNKSDKAIILLHGYPADKGNILPSRLFLQQKYNLLFLDFRYFGDSEGLYTTVGRDEILDVNAAVNYLSSRGFTKIGIWGFSLGGAVALLAGEENTKIRAIVSESAYANLNNMVMQYYRLPGISYVMGQLTRFWGLLFFRHDALAISPAEAIKKIQVPTLIIHSKSDSVISFVNAQQLKEAAKDNPHVKFIFVEDRLHGEPIQEQNPIIENFFNKALK